MSKKSLLALLLVAVMALSGCSLVMKDQEVDNLLTIIDVNGTLVNKQVFANTYEYNLYIEQYYASMLASFGGDGTVDTDAVLQSTIDTIITSLVTSQKCAELGFDQLTAEDEAQVQADAQVAYEEELEYVKEYYFANTELSGEELEAAVAEQAAASGVTLEVMVENARATLISDRLRASVTDLVTVTDEDIQALEYAAATLAGAGEILLQTGEHPGKLKDNVCSPGGSTIAGLNVLEQRAFRGAVMDCVKAAYKRNQELGK